MESNFTQKHFMFLQAVTSNRQERSSAQANQVYSDLRGMGRNIFYIMRCFKALQETCQRKGKDGGRLLQFVFTAFISKGVCNSKVKYSAFSWIDFTPLCPRYVEHSHCKEQQCLDYTGCMLLLFCNDAIRHTQLHTCLLILCLPVLSILLLRSVAEWC